MTDDAVHTPHPAVPDLPRTAVVTGAGRGIGRGLALGLVSHGYDVALLGRTPAHLEAVAAEARGLTVEGGDPRCVVAAVDLTDTAAVRVAAAQVEAELGGVGLLVNNAGVLEGRETPFAADDVDDMWRVVENNLRGPMNMTHALLPGMLARGGGRIVNINSGAGHRPARLYTGYAVSKGALARLTTLIDAQYRDAGIRIFDLAPGVVPTDMTAGMPVHRGRTRWMPIEASIELVLAVADGTLDRLSGRFLRAGDDTTDELVARTYEILVADARRLRLVPYGQTDPLQPRTAPSG
jgi:NAD(P)-dependent dehydrogenase (short-subunit alcohol dehydrogenase family)